MIHTVYLDDNYVNVKKILKQIYSQKEGIRFENSVSNNGAPEGYMTAEQFRAQAKASLINILNEHGIF